MRILVVTQYFWPEEFPINDFVLGLQESGHDVQVLTGLPNYPQGRFFKGYSLFGPYDDEYKGIAIQRVPLIPRGGGKGWQLGINYLSFALSASLFGPLCCRGEYDLIFVYEPSPVTVGLPALVLKKIKDIPLFFWVQDLWPETLDAIGAVKSPWILNLVARLVRYIYNGSDLLLVQSRSFIESIKNHGIGEEKIRYFPNPAEALYRPLDIQPAVQEAVVLPNGFLVMFAGNIGAAQDFPTILSAAERLQGNPDIHWIVLGDGRKKAWVEEEVKNRGLAANVHLLGRHPKKSMPAYFSRADVMLVTLKKEPIFAMTIPSKIQSYLACGRPILAALEGEGQRVIDEAGAGLVVEPENAEKLADAVQTMYNSAESERLLMGERGRDYAATHFDRQKLLARLEEWMQEFCCRT